MESKRNYERTLYASEKNDIDIALAGEALVSQGLSMYTEPRYLELVELIRGADARYVHLEMLFHDYEHAPTDKRSGTFMRCDPRIIADLQWMGFQMMSTAHNIRSIRRRRDPQEHREPETNTASGMPAAGAISPKRAPPRISKRRRGASRCSPAPPRCFHGAGQPTSGATFRAGPGPTCCVTARNIPSTRRHSKTCSVSALNSGCCTSRVRTARSATNHRPIRPPRSISRGSATDRTTT